MHRRIRDHVTCWWAVVILMSSAWAAGLGPLELDEAELSEPEALFEELWRAFDRTYALFGAKHVDWDALYAVYRPRVRAETTDDQLFDILASLLKHLNDNHVWLRSPERTFNAGILAEMTMVDFSLDLVRKKYLDSRFETRVSTPEGEDVFTFGQISENVGYFHFSSFGRLADSGAAIDEIVERLKDARAIVVDVRDNGGGDDRVGKAIADRFADRQRLYMTTRTRDGPGHDDFTEAKSWYVEPGGPRQFTRPVILLTHRFSVSAAENFALAMRTLPHVTVVGDTTSGVFADVYGDVLSNDWRFSVSYKLFEDAHGFCWEGLGVPADLRQINTPEGLAAGRDQVLELALSLAESSALKPRERVSGSTAKARPRISFARVLTDTLESAGGTTAGDQAETIAAALLQQRTDDPTVYYVEGEELEELWTEFLDLGNNQKALAVARLWTRVLPESPFAHRALGETLYALGQPEEARASYARAQEVNRGAYPWERQAAAEVEHLLTGRKPLIRALRSAVRRSAEDSKNFERVQYEYRKTPTAFHVDESAMNGFGYELLADGRVDEALAIFELNAQAFPDSWNAVDSLAESHLAAGAVRRAIEHYERSLKMNPRNANGVEMLARIREEMYLLPYPENEQHLVLQGNFGPFGHQGAEAYAFDFRMPIGTPVYAARGGEVVAMESRFEDNTHQAGEENYVFLRHSDGTFGRYFHLKRAGVVVATGDRIERGQRLGYSGNSGASAAGAHLHFDVTETCPEWGCQTIAVRFANAASNPLESGEFYRALPMPGESVGTSSH